MKQHPNFADNKCFIEEVKKRIQTLLEFSPADQPTSERLALFDSEFKLKQDETMASLKQIEQGSNIAEIIESDMLKDRVVKKN